MSSRHSVGEIDPTTDAEWKKITKKNDSRWYLCCQHTKFDSTEGIVKRCQYCARPGEYDVYHDHFSEEKKRKKEKSKGRQITIFDMMPNIKEFNVITLVAIVAAALNISARCVSTDIFINFINALIEYGYKLKEKGSTLSKVSYSDKDVNAEIITQHNGQKSNSMSEFRSVGYAFAILDAGTVTTHHTLEIILTLPGLLKPLPFESYYLETGTKAEYQKVIQDVYKRLKNEKITLIGVCGDNLAAQKNGLDHTNSKSIQSRSFENVLSLRNEIKMLRLAGNLEETATKTQELNYYSGLSSLMYSPCLNHTVSLAFYDSLACCDILNEYAIRVDKYSEIFKLPEIKDIIGKLNFSVCKTRWIYLFNSLLYLVRNQKLIDKLYDIVESRSDKKLYTIFDKPEYSAISERPEKLQAIVDILWPLHSFSAYLEDNSTLLCYVIPTLDKVQAQIKKRGEKHNLTEISDTILEKIDERLHETGRYELLQASYLLSPFGRQNVKPNREKYFETKVCPPPEIEFFELDSNIGKDSEIQKFYKYIKKSKEIEQEDYIYFRELDDECVISSVPLSDQEKNDFKLEISEALCQSNDVLLTLLETFMETISVYKENCPLEEDNNILIWKEFSHPYDYLVKYTEELTSIFKDNEQDIEKLIEIQLILNKIQITESVEIPVILHELDQCILRAKEISVNNDILEIIFSKISREALQNIDRLFERLDIYSDEVISKLIYINQKIDKNQIWATTKMLTGTSEEMACRFVECELAKILGYDINEIVTAHKSYLSDDCTSLFDFASDMYANENPINFWREVKKVNPVWANFADIAIRLVSIPASEAECERMFSRRKRIISRYHTRISKELIFARASIMTNELH